MIDKFNFYDLYGHAIPGLILVVLVWIPFGLTGAKLPDADLGSAVLGVVVGYVLGHVLQILAQGAFPSKFSDSRGSKLRYPSDIFLDEDNPKLIAAFKRRLLEKIDKDFQLDVRDSAFLSPPDANLRQATRDHAFRLCRSALLRGDKFSYAEQFNGMYVLMRGLVAAFLVAAFFYVGWTVGWTAKYFADPSYVVVTILGLDVFAGTLMAVIMRWLLAPPGEWPKSEALWIWGVAGAVSITGSILAIRTADFETWKTPCSLLAGGVALCFLAFLSRKSHLQFAGEWVTTIYRDFLLVGPEMPAAKEKPRGSF
jgi:hypothetical protein